MYTQELKLDIYFRTMFKGIFGSMSDEEKLDRINSEVDKYEPELVLDAVNLIKTAYTLGMSYKDMAYEIVPKLKARIPAERQVFIFIFYVTLKVLIAMGSDSLVSQILTGRRDIYKEVAATKNRIPIEDVTNKMVEEVLVSSDALAKASYSIDEPVVKNWDEYYYNICTQAARNSKCLSRRIGAILVWDKGIISTGYNGPPRGVPRCDLRWKIDPVFVKKYGPEVKASTQTEGRCPRYPIGFESGQGLEICPAGHAERNALINAARKGIATKGTTMYMSCGIPCTPCMVEIINAGVEEIVVTSLKTYDETAMYVLQQSKLRIRMFDF